jgi:hypothetical protein
MADLPQGAGVLPSHAHGTAALLGKAGVIEEEGSSMQALRLELAAKNNCGG